MSILAINAVFEHAIEQLDRERRRLLSGATASAAVGAPKFDHDGFYATSQALSYVVMGGVLEELMRNLPSALASDITTMAIERRHLPVSLIAATDAETFRKCGSDSVASLVERAVIVKAVLDHDRDARPVVDFGDLFKLADGHTINDRHFHALWMILGLDGDWKNHPNDILLLKEIREKRNDVAHWTEDPVVIGRSKRSSDLTAMVARLIDLIQHFQLNIWYWLEARKDKSGLQAGII